MDNELHGEFVLNDKSEEKSSAVSSKDPFEPKKHAIKHHNSPHFYSSLVRYPKNVRFADQEENEEIILIVRRHFITNIPWLAAVIILAILPFTLFPIIFSFSPFPVLSSQTIFLLAFFYYLIIAGFVLLNFTLWYFHIGIITNIRIRDIDIHGILYKDVSEAKNEFIQDVSYTQIGFVRSIFNYGEVSVQTAGTKPNIEFDKAPRPAEITRIIGDLLGS